MNLFRSKEPIRSWTQFKEGTEEGIIPLDDLLMLFSVSYFRNRLDPDWVSRMGEYRKEILATLGKIGKTGPFWRRPK